ncbi:MAG: EF-hand domain-containing protein [Pararhodobacter sp.]|nr:EF-hand domain-containing protein [Pararhodobacter sp.]
MRMMQVMTAGALALALGAAPAMAGNRSDTAQPARMPAMMGADFADIDADGDGRISPEEWAGFLAEGREAMRARMIEARVEALFEAADADGDGLLSREELAAGMEALHAERMAAREARREAWSEARGTERADMRPRARGERGERGRAGWRHGRMHGRMEGRMGRMGSPEERAERMFRRIDADGDGYISPEEFTSAQTRWTERMERRMQWRAGRGEGRARDGETGNADD